MDDLLGLVNDNKVHEEVFEEFKQRNLLGLLRLIIDKTNYFFYSFTNTDLARLKTGNVFKWVERNPRLLVESIIKREPGRLPPWGLSDELIRLGIENNAPPEFYDYGVKWSDNDALRRAVINELPGLFYNKCKDVFLDDKQLNIIKKFSEQEGKDKKGYDLYGDERTLKKRFFELIGGYGVKVINWAKNDNHLLDVLPLEDCYEKEYAELIKPYLSKKYWKKLINRSFIIYCQDYIKELLTGEKGNTLEELLKDVDNANGREVLGLLEEGIIGGYDKKIGVDNSKELLKVYYCYQYIDVLSDPSVKDFNDSFTEMMEQLIAGEYESSEKYFFKKQFDNFYIRMDSSDKPAQIRLLNKLYSCFNVIRGSEKAFSRSYLLTDRINFAGVYNNKGDPLARFTVVLSPEEQRLGITSGVIKKRASLDFKPQVIKWVESFAENLGYNLGGWITLPVYKFYDDVTPRHGCAGDEETNTVVIETRKKPLAEKVEYFF